MKLGVDQQLTCSFVSKFNKIDTAGQLSEGIKPISNLTEREMVVLFSLCASNLA